MTMLDQPIRSLQGLMNVELSGVRFSSNECAGDHNRVDYSDSEGRVLIIKGQFHNLVDLSGARIARVVLEGVFNVIDLSKAKIGLLDTTRAEIWLLDDSGTKIEIRKKQG